jgi:hypothetical protein
VSYGFEFTGVGGDASAVTSVTGTNGLISLSSVPLALRWGGEYNVSVDVNYALTNSNGDPETIVVEGTNPNANCIGVTMRAHPQLQVRSSQRCSATLLRSNFLIGDRVGVSTPVCGAINYSYEFSQVVACDNSTPVSITPTVYTTTAAAPYLPLGVLPALANPGSFDVRIRPNFAYGPGTFGPIQRVKVNGTAAGVEQTDEAMDQEKNVLLADSGNSIYPNPSNGEFVNVRIEALKSAQVQLRLLDAMGRVIQSTPVAVNGVLNMNLVFDNKLSAGIYFIEVLDGGVANRNRFVVE